MRTSCKQYIEGSWARIEDNDCVLIDLTAEHKLEYSDMLPLYTRRDGYSGSKGYVSVPKGDALVLLSHIIITSNNSYTYILLTLLLRPYRMLQQLLSPFDVDALYIRLIWF